MAEARRQSFQALIPEVKGVLTGDGGQLRVADSGERRSKMAGHETSGRANPPHSGPTTAEL